MSTYKIELTIIADTENELSRDDAFALVEKIEKEFSSLRLRNILFRRSEKARMSVQGVPEWKK